MRLVLLVLLAIVGFSGSQLSSAQSTTTTTTVEPAATTSDDEPQGVNITALPSCPFSRWNGEPRYCYECRWCPFRASTCCEMEDEIDVLKSINVSGSDDWDCFITIMHFQQCAKCSPSAKTYVQNKLMPYVWDARNLSIRVCKQACQFIYKQCRGVQMLSNRPVVPNGQSVEEFCKDAPEVSTAEFPCYNSVAAYQLFVSVVVAVATILIAVAA